jgi:hypothetical protein
VAAARGDLLDAPGDLGEVGIDDVAHDHPDDAARPLDEGAGELARPVTQLFGGREDARAQCF